MCRIRKNAYPFSVTGMRVDGTKVILNATEMNEKEPAHHLHPFPAVLDDAQDASEAILLHLSSVDAMIYLYGLAKEFLQGELRTSRGSDS